MARLVVDGMSVFKTLAGAAAHLDRGYSYAFMTQLTAAVKKFKPGGVVVAWEGGHAHRAKLLPEYKSNRSDSSDLVRAQRAEVQDLLRVLAVDQYQAIGHEADDVVATLAAAEGEQIVMSGDKDMLQLVSPRVSVYQKVRGEGTKAVRTLITADNFALCTGWNSPAHFLKAHCALGDAVDQIPKIPGVGPNVIHSYFTGAEIPEAKRRKLDEFYADSEQYLLNRKLIQLDPTACLDSLRVDRGRWSEGDVYNLLRDYGFNSLLQRFDAWIEPWYAARPNADVPALS